MGVALAAARGHGQTQSNAPAAPRPTVGLVLGGGGALGFAHIGVLKVLQGLLI